LKGSLEIKPTITDTRDIFFHSQNDYDVDFSHVQGQENIKRALEIAAAGGHNAIMIGPPGAGKLCLPNVCQRFCLHSLYKKLSKRPDSFSGW
jgi:magnesium chelatase family protein